MGWLSLSGFQNARQVELQSKKANHLIGISAEDYHLLSNSSSNRFAFDNSHRRFKQS
jgi:hypothetical protein